MGTLWKSTAAAIAFSAIAAATTPASAQGYDNGYGSPPGNGQTQGYGGYGPPQGYPYNGNDQSPGYGPPPNYSDESGPPPGYGEGYANAPNGDCDPADYDPNQPMPPECQPYCDPNGCPDDSYDMPVWYGPVFYDNAWLNGPVYYRDWYGQRQYWIHGGWHYDAWRGPRPSWWNASHYHTGPALGRGNYRNHGAGNATNGVRVWRGAQGSPYFNDGGRRFERQGFAGHQNTGQAITHGNSQFANRNPRTGSPVQHGPQNRTSGGHSYSSNGHNFSAGQNYSFSGGGGGEHHGHGH